MSSVMLSRAPLATKRKEQSKTNKQTNQRSKQRVTLPLSSQPRIKHSPKLITLCVAVPTCNAVLILSHWHRTCLLFSLLIICNEECVLHLHLHKVQASFWKHMLLYACVYAYKTKDKLLKGFPIGGGRVHFMRHSGKREKNDFPRRVLLWLGPCFTSISFLKLNVFICKLSCCWLL